MVVTQAHYSANQISLPQLASNTATFADVPLGTEVSIQGGVALGIVATVGEHGANVGLTAKTPRNKRSNRTVSLTCAAVTVHAAGKPQLVARTWCFVPLQLPTIRMG